ncbi:hypothetical protein Q5L94_13890, partial [Idiomarina sp. Sol25]|uniref:hypothetical protein n=1 Tax=Idiomarina sp. Sol25 TaxID=3064000 RepID=UPI00294AA019
LLAALGAISLAALIAFLIRHQAGLNSAHPAPPPPSNDVVSVVPSTATATPASTPSAGGSAIIQGDVSDRDLATSNGDVHIRTGDG